MSWFPRKNAKDSKVPDTVRELLAKFGEDTNWPTYGDVGTAVTAYSAMMSAQKAAMRATYKPPPDPIEVAQDVDLILELIKRGYAVGRLNDKNQLET